jgi:hypothetical protein
MKVKTVGGLVLLIAAAVVFIPWSAMDFKTSRNPGEGPERDKMVRIATLGNNATAKVSFSMHRGLVPIPTRQTVDLPASVGETVEVTVTGPEFNSCFIRQVDRPNNEQAANPNRPDATARCKITVLP